MKSQDHNGIDSMNTLKSLDSDRLLDWWSKQAKANPDSAGILSVYGESNGGLLYRVEAEWLHFLRIVPLNCSMRVLELGCGAGRWALRIAPFVDKVIGVDFSEDMIKLARKRQRELLLNNIEFFVAAAQNSIWETNFDVVYLSGITSCLNEPQLLQTLGNIQTMLAPGGILIDRTSISLGMREVYDNGDYQGIYRTIHELKSVFEKFGFNLTYRAPSYTRMRLPQFILTNRLFQKFMEVGLHRFPKTSVLFISGTTWLLERAKTMACDAQTRSHDFLVFNKENQHITK